MKASYFNPSKFPFYLLLIAIFCWYFYNFFYGERVFSSNGIGWDGNAYANMAMHDELFFQQLSFYYIQRILTSFTLHHIAGLVHYPLTNSENIIHAFYLLDIFLIIVSALIYFSLAKKQKWSWPLQLMGFSSLFLNFVILKFLPYYPVLTDFSAFALSLLMINFYVKQKPTGLLITTVLGAFCFPTIVYCGLFFLLFPYEKKLDHKRSTIQLFIKKISNTNLIAASFALVFVLAALYYFITNPPPLEMSYPQLYAHNRPTWLLNLSFISLFIYLFLMVKPFIKKELSFELSGRNFFGIVLFFIILRISQLYLSTGEEGPVTIILFLRYILIEAIVNPLVFIVSHTFYYGPAVLMILLFWTKIVNYAFEKSKGLVLFLLLYGFLMIGSESREFINAFPIFVFLLCESLKEVKISLSFASIYMLICLVISKFWYSINVAQFATYDANVNPLEFLTFPYQRFFMNMGPWLNNRVYFYEAIIVLFLTAFFWQWKNKSHGVSFDLSRLSSIEGMAKT